METNVKNLIDQLYKNKRLNKEEWITVLNGRDEESMEYLFSLSRPLTLKYFKNEIYIRGLIEFTNICRNDCYYCGIRKSNRKADRYRLTMEDILSCCEEGYQLGFRTFVLQGGEDAYFTRDKLSSILSEIKKRYPDCALTLSFGEWSKEDYQAWFDAGADRYLLRHETASFEHYRKLHPKELSLENRMRCLKDLKEIGYQVGTGFMVQSPFQTNEDLAQDFLFIQDFKPEMIGIGPFVCHHDTPFKDYPTGSVDLTIYCIGLLRLVCPDALIPATTALGTISKEGRERGILAGANVIMPNLSPMQVRKKYLLYDNKISTGDESAQARLELQKRLEKIGYTISASRGDYQKREEVI